MLSPLPGSRLSIVFASLAAVLLVVLLVVPGTAQQTDTKGEHFIATAVNMDAPAGAAATPVDIQVDRWSTDTERDQLMNTMMESGPDKLLDVIQKLRPLGTIHTPDSVGYQLRYARHTPGAGGAERVVIITDRPISFFELKNQTRSSDYPFTVIELRIDSNGKGEGRMSFGTKITADKTDRTITLENYTAQPIMLNEVRREK